jgi:membrane-associated phospholipid phosphatase
MEILYYFAQTSPRLMPIYAFLFGLIMIDYSIILLGIFSFINIIINLIIKGLFKKLYGYLKVKRLLILGLGERPSGICNNNIDYGYFNKYSNIKETQMFGMPSGHSQSAWFVFTFLVLYLFDKYRSLKISKSYSRYQLELMKKWIICAIIFLLMITIFISYSRVKINCHTIEQVVLGGILGIIFGFISYKISKIIINLKTNKT